MKINDGMATVKIIKDPERPNTFCACLTDAPNKIQELVEECFCPENMNKDYPLQQFQKEMIARMMAIAVEEKVHNIFSSTNVCVGGYEITDEQRERCKLNADRMGKAIAIYNAAIQFRMLARVVVESVVKEMHVEKYYSEMLEAFCERADNEKIYDEVKKMISYFE